MCAVAGAAGYAADPGGAQHPVETTTQAPVSASEPRSPDTDQRLNAADRRLALGKQAYSRGDLEGARREFDGAVDALLNAPENLPDRRRLERKLDEVSDQVYRFDLERLGRGETGEAPEPVAFDQAPIDQLRDMTFPVDQSLLPKLNTELQQTSSAIPLDLSDPVLSFIHYFSTDYGRKVLLSGFRRAGLYKPMIQRILAEEGVPQELIYLAQAESGFLPRAISRARAMGMWQFIAGTGQLYDLAREGGVDERFDPEKATRAAARLLKDLHQRYGDWYLAMAAYNCGAGNVDRAVERTGYADYWQLLKLRALPKETSNYVPIIVAMTIMAKNPQDYQLENIEEENPIEYDNLRLDAPTNVSLLADAARQPASLIRDLNPALLTNIAPAAYQVHIPKGTAEGALSALDAVPLANRKAWRLHHVAAGDNLESIASQYKTPAERIIAVNKGADVLDEGDVLRIPAVYREPVVKAQRARRSTAAKTRVPVASSHASVARRGTHAVASGRVSSNVLRRRAALRTASLHR
jgi:membrane-bound lytic murein transglycosylase D